MITLNPAQTKWQLSAIQFNSQPDPESNLYFLREQLAQLPRALQHLVVLPECFAVFGGAEGVQQRYQEPLGHGPIQQACAALAQQYQLYLVAGSLPTCTDEPTRFAASSVFFAPDGQLLADYQKLHLFDVSVNDSMGSYRESLSTQPGKKLTLSEQGSLKLGMTICYDVRFAGLTQALADQGMNVLSVPAAFTEVTGAAHWHTLLRARAIESQSFVVAPGQTGTHANGRKTFGHSLIISPWGEVLAEAGSAPGWISVAVDLADCQQLAVNMPVKQHNRFRSELK
ncbi:carbon-nitrogen hydrolase family protein [Alishewanella sp. 16-MA]|uniref:Carbon-nitrogen hydrolase family protein n=1 Tax=Alishewanella maricola TaxID=2795740 RepID=A0ABS8C8T8_9ALTE|nr:carbon-nitrogen hydrolase family protein [Alishewanella maricola]MCB5228365.1 carbon-nitrogen hydrolase family protein [Alishewanella maricola]